MPYPIAALISWRPFYQSNEEPYYTRQDHDGASHDFQNFLKSGSGNAYFYGYAPVKGNLSIERLADGDGDCTNADSIEGVTVYWLARRPLDDKLCLVGWYEDTEVFRRPQRAPILLPETRNITYRFRTRRAYMFPEAQRPEVNLGEMGIPRQLRSNVTYLNENLPKVRNPGAIHDLRRSLELLTDERFRPDGLAVTLTVREFRRRKTHEIIERSNSYRQFRNSFGNTCQACGFVAEEEPWSRALELHHLVPMRELDPDQVRTATREEFALLCATCHRAIHATDWVGKVEEFWRKHSNSARECYRHARI